MEHIIHQIAQELIEEVTKKAFSSKINDIDSLAGEVEQDCRKAAKSIIEAIAATINLQIRKDKTGRKERGLVMKEKDRPRRLHTKLGVLELPRDYYYDKATGTYIAILDHILGLVSYERVGRTLSAEMVELAADVSYAKSARLSSRGELSRQTVRNHILKLSVPEHKAAPKKRAVKELHIYADEDHVHMQKEGKAKGKKNQIVPLVTVTEGTEPVSKVRNRTQKKVHFVDEDFNPKRLWKTVEGYIAKAYDINGLEKIYVHGDGGNWIKNGLENFAQTEHVMDGYHYGKALRKLSGMYPKRNIRVVIENAIRDDEYAKADEYLKELNEGGGEKERKALAEFRTYLRNNWNEIRNLKVLDIPGSCTEAQVSHVLSDRFSRDPLGWSKEGLGKLSCIRVYKENGNHIKAADFANRKQNDTYLKYADEIIKESIAGRFDWSIFDGEPIVYDTSSGTQVLIGAMGTDHGILRN